MKRCILILFIGLYFGSCGGSHGDPNPIDDPEENGLIAVTEIEVSETSIRLNIGGTRQLSYFIFPDSATNKEVTWSTSEETVATVSASGLVTAIGAGSATITLTSDDGAFESTAKVFVSDKIVYYESSDEDFINPERGFYKYTETRSSNYSPLSVSTLKGYRNGTSSGSYSTVNALVFRYFVLADFTDKPISDEYLANAQADFDVAREAGVKLIPRFTYTISTKSGDCREEWICTPYGDAPKDIVLQHIAQLGPIITQNKDVILAVQMGFIGVWGENYYTDYFGDASANGGVGKLLDENWQDRIDVLNALLDATPEDIMIQVRYPQMKQRTVNGINATTAAAAITKDEAFKSTPIARIGFHNDCLFASSDDYGTYQDYGNSSSSAKTDITNLKKYFSDDSKYVIVGGETCSDSYNPQNNCAPEGMAVEDLRYLHYTYLNADYNNEVNQDWVEGDCMNEIKRSLGYRIVLDSADLPKEVSGSELLNVKLYLRNVGFASPMKERYAYLILKSDGATLSYKFDMDLRFWDSSIVLNGAFEVPSDERTYDLYLSIPDINASISDRPEYAVRLASKDIWDAQSGLNNLNHQVSKKP